MGRAKTLLRGTFLVVGVYMLVAQLMGWPALHWSLLMILAALFFGWKASQVRNDAQRLRMLWKEASPESRRQMRNLTLIAMAIAALFTAWAVAQP